MDKRLKILLYSHYFHPSIGGLETVSLSLANGFTLNGIDCKVVTTSVNANADKFAFEVVRNPNRKQQINLVKWADVVLFNGTSLALQPWILLYRKPFVWIHVGYQVSCIDGLGWVNGEKAPITPFASFIYHSKLKGWGWGVKQGLKLGLRRFVAKYLVSKNVTITEWMNKMQPLPRQVHIYNPFPLNQFLSPNNMEPEYDFLYLGRIVSEKGVSTLLKAFAIVMEQTITSPQLLMIGDGKWKQKMENLANDLNITKAVTFIGKKSGQELVDSVSKGRIAVIPSEWYEPMGGVAIELMAAGKNLIVSERGGLKECVGDAGLTFPNGDYQALANCMIALLEDKALQQEQILKGKARIKLFDSSIFITQYIHLLDEIVTRKN
jgi:glycosyltransferase involved in cell wall biosynthesis